MRFSILIPVYNTSKYLRECLDSVLAQDFHDYEIILVNDGSTDNSAEICKEYAKKDQRIKYFSKQNEGLLLTRRFSLPLSSGEYILFLDSDDYWDGNLLSTINQAIIDNKDIDMILFRYRRVSDSGQLKYVDNNLFEDNTVFSSDNYESLLKCFVSSSRLNNIWSKCVKRSIIDIEADYSYFKDKKGEDLLQSVTLFKNSTNVLYINKDLMNYRLSVNGRGRNVKLKYLADFNVVRTHVLKVLIEMNVSPAVLNDFYVYYLNSLILRVLSTIGKTRSIVEYKNIANRILQSEIFTRAIPFSGQLSIMDRLVLYLLKDINVIKFRVLRIISKIRIVLHLTARLLLGKI